MDSPLSSGFGDRAADFLADGMGSWRFIIAQTVGIVCWIVMNLAQAAWFVYHGRPFDPFPFILLNLLFSTQSAYAAPIIMIAQRRKDAKQREHIERIVATVIEDAKLDSDTHERLLRLCEQHDMLHADHQAQSAVINEIAQKVGATKGPLK